MSRIFSGAQEPKLHLAQDLARALDVTVDHLASDSLDGAAITGHLTCLSDEEFTILKLVRRLGSDEAMDRLLGVKPRETRSAGPRVTGESGFTA